MVKAIFYSLIAILAGYLITFFPFGAITFLGIAILCLLFVKYEQIFLYSVIFFLPFSFALNPSPDIDLATNRVLIIVLFLIWLANSLARKKLNIAFNPITLALSAFLFLAAFSVFTATETSWALRKLLVFVSIFPLYFVVSDLVRSWNNIKKVIFVMSGSAFLVSLIGLGQFFSQFFLGIQPIFSFWTEYIAPYFYGANFGKLVVENPSWLVNIGGSTYLRALSLFPDPHMFAFYLGLILPLVFSLLIFSFKGKEINEGFFTKRSVLLIVFGVILLTLGLTFSRSGYIGIAASLATVTVLSWRHLRSFSRFIVLAAMASFLIMLIFTDNPVSSRLLSIGDLAEGSNAGRIQIWQEAVDIIDANLLIGVGLGNYSLEINPVADYRNSIYAHNTYLDIAAEMGIFAAIIWVLLLGASVRRLINNLTRNREDIFKIAVIIGLIGSVVSFAVSSLADTALYSSAVLGMLMIILGLVSGITEKNSKVQIINDKSSPNY